MKTGHIEVHEGGKRIILTGSFIPASEAELNHLQAQIDEHRLVALAYPPTIELGELKLHVEFVPLAEVQALQCAAEKITLVTKATGTPGTISAAVPEGEELSDEDQAKLAELSGSGGLAGNAAGESLGEKFVRETLESPGVQLPKTKAQRKAEAKEKAKAAENASNAPDPAIQ